ncbi:putative N-acetyltransferase YjcF [Roseivivax sp. THAF40]|uniref:GNAT family N-acetyltransferase n=1 Tax=unclassified Roseivivax TaxID=2639302 RepID=UPI0012695F81|nr:MULTISPECIES: GNAT family N-acetyltransferase [unclassified Roseivivax]QFS81322.1 putative N-acetyltransferase YjcF [Roseivivax sp. THAF197b]QFT45051.1 putative N-acetyltransferase YjcF [Roseivivax sp. THAF40]
MSVTISEAPDFAPVRALRMAVFVHEQGFTEASEFDALDATATHLLASDGSRPIGCARLYMDGGEGRIGRICVLPEGRGRGIGAALVHAGLAHYAAREVGIVALGAQVRAMPFYEGLGFTAYGPVYDDEGVPHRMMRRAP